MATKKTTKKKTSPLYNVELYTMGRRYNGKGKTLETAIDKLGLKSCKAKAVLTVKRGDKTVEKVLSPTSINRFLICNGLSRNIALKQITQMFDL
jgi:hypothetical protein